MVSGNVVLDVLNGCLSADVQDRGERGAKIGGANAPSSPVAATITLCRQTIAIHASRKRGFILAESITSYSTNMLGTNVCTFIAEGLWSIILN